MTTTPEQFWDWIEGPTRTRRARREALIAKAQSYVEAMTQRADDAGRGGRIIALLLDALRDAPDWQPIDSAPTDQDVLVCQCGEPDSVWVARQRSQGEWASTEGSPLYMRRDTDPPEYGYRFTHWMPLPLVAEK